MTWNEDENENWLVETPERSGPVGGPVVPMPSMPCLKYPPSTFSEQVPSMHVTQLTPADLSAINLAFVEHMGNADKKYKIRAIKLVSISRDFAQAAEHNRSYDELRR